MIRILALILAAPLAHLSPAAATDYRPGPYAGLSLGYGLGATSAAGLDIATEGYQIGGVAGFTLATTVAIAGAEIDIAVNGVEGSAGSGAVTVASKGAYVGTARALLGLPMGAALPYLTAGLAVSDQVLKGGGNEASTLRWGPVVGAGLRLQVTGTMQADVVALRTFWVDRDFRFAAGTLSDVAADTTVVRAGVLINLN